ncbi:Lar family restriction alleviation protein [Ralstonia sp. CP]|uniref:Lar family restriction alleviation protein n=1 Tax=Ralstonia sp. CP TaxID=3231757 RepID=UPI00345BCA0C
MSEPKLLPCPFCGGPVKLERATDTYEMQHGRRQWWGVVCRNTMNLGGSCAIEQRPSASVEAAVTRWNTRAKPEHGEG